MTLLRCLRGLAGSRICDHVPLRNCRLWEHKNEVPPSVGQPLSTLIHDHASCLPGRRPSSAVHHFGGYEPRNRVLLLRFAPAWLQARTWRKKSRHLFSPEKRKTIDAPRIPLSLLQSSQLGLARAPILCSHFPHGKEHVITCLALLFLASCTAPDLIHEPRNSLLSPSLSQNSAAQVVVVGLLQFSSSCSWTMHLLPQRSLLIRSP